MIYAILLLDKSRFKDEILERANKQYDTYAYKGEERRYVLMHINPEETSYTRVNTLTVFTLGRFDVRRNGHSLSEVSSGSKKIWELFKFMITHRRRHFTPESLLETLWPSENYLDPHSTLRQQMYRLRQILEESHHKSEQQAILFNNGYYHWNLGSDVQFDIDQFEKSVYLGNTLKEDQPEKALLHYREALSLYQGDYLSECLDQHWIFPIQNYYRRLYQNTVFSAIDLLRVHRKFNEILQICEQAIQLDVYKEEFHLCYIDALLQHGERKQALLHYEHITGFFYQKMGLKPSLALKSIYKRILSTQTAYITMDALKSDLESDTILENAFYCNPEIFRSIYELEHRRSERSEIKAVIGMITMSHSLGESLGKQQQRMMSFRQHLLEYLRKGDTVTSWNDSQFLVLLPGLDEIMMDSVLTRIVNLYILGTSDTNCSMQIQYHLMLPPQDNPRLINGRNEYSV